MNYLMYFAQKINADALPKADEGKIPEITNVVFAIFGAIAVIVVIWAGIQMIISQGNSEKVAQARRSIIYAIAGLVVISFAQVIVWFINGNLTKP
jgi:hypothetical protein